MSAPDWQAKYQKALRDLADGPERARYLASLTENQTLSVQVWPHRNPPVGGTLPLLPSWITSVSERKDCYQLDLTSAMVGSHLAGLPQGGAVLDLCASPGGKSVLAYGFLQPDLLVANEVIGKRLAALTDTIERLELFPAIITRHDPSVWKQHASGYFSAVLVDAPCSGQSLCFRGVDHPAAWYEGTVQQAVMRQRRILAAAADLVAPGGFLLYSTCTFSRAENEGVVEWLCAKRDDLGTVPMEALAQFRSTYTKEFCSRFWPGEGYGAGGFAALFQKQGTSNQSRYELPPGIQRIHEYA